MGWPVLKDIHERFLNLYWRKEIEILTFQEACGMKGTSFISLNLNQKVLNSSLWLWLDIFLPLQVVDDVLSAFNREENRFSIDANHMTMCRYRCKEDYFGILAPKLNYKKRL